MRILQPPFYNNITLEKVANHVRIHNTIISPLKKMLNSSMRRNKYHTIIQQEVITCISLVLLRATAATIGVLAQKKIHPYLLATTLIVIQALILSLIIRKTFYDRTAFNQQKHLLEQYENIPEDNGISNHHEKDTARKQCVESHIKTAMQLKIALTVIAICTISSIVTSVLSTLLYQQERIATTTSLVLGVIAFLLGVIPDSIASTTAIISTRSSIAATTATLKKVEDGSFTKPLSVDDSPFERI